jgi:hypothetical protein
LGHYQNAVCEIAVVDHIGKTVYQHFVQVSTASATLTGTVELDKQRGMIADGFGHISDEREKHLGIGLSNDLHWCHLC